MLICGQMSPFRGTGCLVAVFSGWALTGSTYVNQLGGKDGPLTTSVQASISKTLIQVNCLLNVTSTNMRTLLIGF